MRIHELTIEAFGPFVERQVVDFDALSSSGLFLVHGPTGAGKTSVLDAICFALFANVPGARSARALRSDLAPADRAATVRLEFTAGGRRLRVTRKPEHPRPKKRGTGTVKAPASVVLEEFDQGGWRAKSTRIDEAADVINDVVGMGLEQFARVALLPQGDFATFLRASVEARRELLERLFDVTAYTRAEAWLLDERRRLTRTVAEDERELGAHLRHLTDLVAGLPTDPDGAALLPPAAVLASGTGLEEVDAADLPQTVSALRTQLHQLTSTAMADYDTAIHDEQSAADQDSRARAASDARARGLAAQEALVARAAESEEIEALRERLDAAMVASALRGEIATLRTAADDLASAEAQHAQSAAAVDELADSQALLATWGPHWDRVELRLDQGATVLANADEATRLAADLDKDRRGSLDNHASATAGLAAASAELAALADAQLACRQQLADHRRRAATGPDAREALTTCQRRLRLRAAIEDATASLANLAVALPVGKSAELDAKERLLNLRQARLDDLSGELASTLTPGCPCPVCGSVTHPAPGSRGADWSPEAIDAAELALTSLTEAYVQLDLSARELAARRTTLIAEFEATAVSPGGSTTDLPALAAVRDALTEAETRVHAAGAAEDAAALSQRHLDELTSRGAALEQVHAASLTAVTAAGSVLDDLTTRIATATAASASLMHQHARECPCVVAGRWSEEPAGPPAGPEGAAPSEAGPEGAAPSEAGPEALAGSEGSAASAPSAGSAGSTESADLAAVTDRHRRLRRAIAALRRAHDEHADASRRHDAALTDVTERLKGSPFADRAALAAALLTPAQMRPLSERLRRHDEMVAVHGATLADEVVAAALADPHPLDPIETGPRQREAKAQLLAGRSAVDVLSRLSADINRLGESIGDLCTRLIPERQRLDEVAAMAELTSGGGANDYRMRLSSFVLAARLERVVELANERLAVMGEGRFRLQHDDALAARGARSGLGLRVLDEWTGTSREPASLSGGESFMTSLALALGLADAVRENAGGQELQTLFVDEGFGSLDEESLEHVMSVLDTLRDGGRAVGVVSHVADLRGRITHRLAVTKSPTGSTLTASAATQGVA